jgi:hypothetical protein
MTTSPNCYICRKPDVRRLVELGWNAKMSAPQISTAMAAQFSATTILKHLHEHVEEGAGIRAIPIEDARPMSARVAELQRMQLDEIERRITMAQEWAAYAREQGNPDADWSQRYDLLDKDNQAAIASIIKAQAVGDKRESKQNDQKVDLIRMMLGGGDGLAPKHLIEDGLTVEGVAVEVPDAPSGPDTD